MFNVVLYQPEIPPNTGNVIRLCANTGCRLHLIEPLGFSMEDRLLRRAGLDYHEWARVERHTNWAAFLETQRPDHQRVFALSTRAGADLYTTPAKPGDWFVFGAETSGLPSGLLDSLPAGQRLRLPMRPGQRSLNLSNAVAVVVYEAWRQNDFGGA